MCVIFFTLGHPKYKLIIAGNRDEFIDRVAQRAHFWSEIGAPNVLAGTDQGKIHVGVPLVQSPDPDADKVGKVLEYSGAKYERETITKATPQVAAETSGVDQSDETNINSSSEALPLSSPDPSSAPLQTHGTWMGINKATGHLGFITNFREHPSLVNPTALTRGYLVRDFLLSCADPQTYAETVASQQYRYNGFNLVLGAVNPGGNEDVVGWYCGNRGPVRDEPPTLLKKGVIYGMSNGVLMEKRSDWPKVERGKELLEHLLSNPPDDHETLINSLLDVLRDKTTYPDSDLPSNMFNYDLERSLCPICIDRHRAKGGYGTRTHTVLLVDNENRGRFVEVDRYRLVDGSSGKKEVEEKDDRVDFSFILGS
ncbi:uncharacterized protein SPPG_00352 [Spizellomyces punctatus DAOM BR117]|uniref:Uncharacterized protein n=1 Tax=Spizellomyces punctatus (strain DAOM BR117) TaxID=645134 RepID=A0A0L0HUR9_SPIPD|nr:uncharacterized protein SPPG_00352 [Spizellomyces punctatus DAOM BR117]KND04635.1 hypothetical protein SPPG_00352 [Spizellomyces punctatus DAOM BR117]|eukprot:XP_016612674.1 hypothetical protein SPPG_00352 [Spizellomyces punctatus DAOM BR117]